MFTGDPATVFHELAKDEVKSTLGPPVSKKEQLKAAVGVRARHWYCIPMLGGPGCDKKELRMMLEKTFTTGPCEYAVWRSTLPKASQEAVDLYTAAQELIQANHAEQEGTAVSFWIDYQGLQWTLQFSPQPNPLCVGCHSTKDLAICPSCLTNRCASCASKPEYIALCRESRRLFDHVLKLSPGLLTSHRRFCFNIHCPNTVRGRCVSAGELKCQACGRCRKVSYCTKDCQRADWADHKADCTSS